MGDSFLGRRESTAAQRDGQAPPGPTRTELLGSAAAAALPSASREQPPIASQGRAAETNNAAPAAPLGETPANDAKGQSLGGAASDSGAAPITAAPSAEEPSKPAASSGGVAPSAAPPLPRLAAAEIVELLARGDGFLRIGDVASARLYYERAADAGDGRAALRIGATFDPTFLARAGLRGVRGDVAKARFWYGRALEFGAADAAVPLDSLGKK